MNFKRRRPEEPEINLIPFIDVLLVVLIFLMLSTTYSRYSELQITLPTARAQTSAQTPREVQISVAADGRYSVNQQPVAGQSVAVLAAALREAAGTSRPEDVALIVSADAMATHQSVVNVMDAARRAGLPQLSFATQSTDGSAP